MSPLLPCSSAQSSTRFSSRDHPRTAHAPHHLCTRALRTSKQTRSNVRLHDKRALALAVIARNSCCRSHTLRLLFLSVFGASIVTIRPFGLWRRAWHVDPRRITRAANLSIAHAHTESSIRSPLYSNHLVRSLLLPLPVTRHMYQILEHALKFPSNKTRFTLIFANLRQPLHQRHRPQRRVLRALPQVPQHLQRRLVWRAFSALFDMAG